MQNHVGYNSVPRRRTPLRTLALAASLLVSSHVVHGAVIATHAGANDPTANGWATSGSFSGVATGPVINDMGSGINAWKVDDNGTGGGQVGWYTHALSASEVADAAAFGWRLSANVRVVDVPDPGPGDPAISLDASPFFAYRSGTMSAQVHLGSEADGDPIAHFLTSLTPHQGVSGTLQGGGGGYHLYEMVFDVVDGISVSIDGTTLITNQSAFNLSAPTEVLFGAGSSCCTGQGNFNSVTFETLGPGIGVPAPAPLLLLALGLLGLRLRRAAFD